MVVYASVATWALESFMQGVTAGTMEGMDF